MDPFVTTLVSALAAGAAKGLVKTGESAVVSTYAALKQLIQAKYGSKVGLLDSVAALEAKPESPGRREVLAEELRAAGTLEDSDLIAAAEQVLAPLKRRACHQQWVSTGTTWSWRD